MSANHYETLGLTREATPEDIKRAYRSLSLKWHPDRNPSPEARAKFQEISSANEILSDDARRQQYNMELDGGPVPGPGSGMSEMDINNIFNMMFQGAGMPPFGGMGEMRFGVNGGPEIHVFHGMPFGANPQHFFRQLQKPPPIIKDVEITLQQSYGGCMLRAEVEKWVIHNDMKVREVENIHLNIPAGIENNDVIIVRDAGNVASPELKGDIKIIVKIVQGDSIFERSGMDLVCKRDISLKESLTGFTLEFMHLNGKMINLNNAVNPFIVKPNYKKTIPGLGMVRNGNTGNLIIEFNVVFPESLTEEQANVLRSTL
jgi:DnaJ-class molecular chaperone